MLWYQIASILRYHRQESDMGCHVLIVDPDLFDLIVVATCAR